MAHALVLNAGSSSLKFGLFRGRHPELVTRGQVERIGGAAQLHLRDADGTALADTALPGHAAADHAGALSAVLHEVKGRFPEAEIGVVGHRVVHGGMEFAAPTRITPEVLRALERLEPFAPLHQPHNLAGIRAALRAFPEARQVACFDTGFHRNHPFVNDTFALPRAYYEKGVRRYGFHGLSYDYISGALAEMAPTLHAGRVVVAHLGNGASMCGLLGGRSIASSMGFSALDGLPMGTRSGQLDPGVVLYLMDSEGMNAAEISELLYRRSGLLGLSGISSDMRTLLASDDPRASEAVDYFCFRIRRELGGLAAALEGLDAVVFTGGIGENAAPVRAQVCRGLRWIGIELDEARNVAKETVISSDMSRVRVLVIPTNEELVIARAAMDLGTG
ncbi:acetate kinase [Mameliella alba]|uniref:acetate/propionate family kinase n=1 Tax=Mameliella alba TaxID=561184 RepID=UPI00088A9E3F|nr:acetate/propionate family kinase [Mameliella alba]OWV49826.1 acetate kinase [Mameliella alba]PTR41835.1 acetate kinase [Mameliella alba]GGF54878.1 acetate kinase [Mameliella alba]SDC29136.1 acetate kinase [Mameliella alba]